MPDCWAVMELTTDQSNYGPARGQWSLGRDGWDGERGVLASGDRGVEGTWLLGR